MTYEPIPNVLVLGLGHKARHGKDTVAQAMVDTRNAVVRVGFADALYDYCRIEHGMGAKDAPLLQQVGVEMRARNPQTWIDVVYWRIKDIAARLGRNGVVVIPDVRFVNEAEFVREMNGFLIKVERRDENNVLFQASDRDPNHISETNLDSYVFDLTITNRSVTTTRYNAQLVLGYFKEIHHDRERLNCFSERLDSHV